MGVGSDDPSHHKQTLYHAVTSSSNLLTVQSDMKLSLQMKMVYFLSYGARCSSVVRVYAHGAMGRRIDPSWGGHIELFLVPASAPRLV